MTRRFIQIRGCMGSGKTSAMREYINRGNFEVCFIEVFGKKYPYTYDKSKNTLITGRYDRNVCGGIDGIIKNKEIVKEYLIKLIRQVNPTVMMFEAVMYGVTFKFSNDLNNLCKVFGYQYTAIALIAPFDVIISRIEGRNGGKPIKIEQLEKSYSRYLSSTKKLEQAGVDVRYFNTLDYTKDNMNKILEATI